MFLHLIASELAALQDQKEKASLSSGSNTTTARHSDLQHAMERVGFGSLWDQATAYLQTKKTDGEDESSSTKVVKTKKRKRKPPEITQEMIDEQERLLAQSQQKQNALSKKST